MRARTFAERYLATILELDADRMTQFYARNGVVEFMGRTAVGGAGIRSLFAEMWADVVQVEGTLGRVFESAEGIAFEWTSQATFHSGRVISARGVDVMTLAEEKIVRSTVYLASGVADG